MAKHSTWSNGRTIHYKKQHGNAINYLRDQNLNSKSSKDSQKAMIMHQMWKSKLKDPFWMNKMGSKHSKEKEGDLEKCRCQTIKTYQEIKLKTLTRLENQMIFLITSPMKIHTSCWSNNRVQIIRIQILNKETKLLNIKTWISHYNLKTNIKSSSHHKQKMIIILSKLSTPNLWDLIIRIGILIQILYRTYK
jgi:hypothetical protein